MFNLYTLMMTERINQQTTKNSFVFSVAFLLLAGAFCFRTESAIAHGVNIQYQTTQAIAIDAIFDNGKPLTNAQVSVYTPDDPETPWLKGTTDEKGRFTFTPDPTKTGNWAVRVRQAGHGNIINIPIAPLAVASDRGTKESGATDTGSGRQLGSRGSTGLTPLQTGLAIASGVWGFIGTALFFSRSRSQHSALTKSQ